MQQILIIILIIAAFWYGRRLWKKQSRANRIRLTLYIIGGTLLILAVAGKLSWLTAPVGALIGILPLLLPKILIFLRSFLLLRKAFHFFKNPQDRKQQSSQTRAASTWMTEEEALNILGLKAAATRQEIITAHKRLIQKLHPDRGGSSALAAQINTAKKVLLK